MLPELCLWTVALFGAGAILMRAVHRQAHAAREVRRRDWLKYGLFAAIVHGMLFAAALGRPVAGALLTVIVVIGLFEIRANAGTCTHAARVALPLALLLIAGGLHVLAGSARDWFPHFSFLFLTVALTDSYAQLWGRLLGRHAMCPVISPHKTWEGCLGGCLIGAFGGALIGVTVLRMAPVSSLALATWTAIWATAGDLIFSRWKRQRGIKDFSRLLPGHGGVLDRFDSLVVAAPALFWLRWLWAV